MTLSEYLKSGTSLMYTKLWAAERFNRFFQLMSAAGIHAPAADYGIWVDEDVFITKPNSLFFKDARNEATVLYTFLKIEGLLEREIQIDWKYDLVIVRFLPEKTAGSDAGKIIDDIIGLLKPFTESKKKKPPVAQVRYEQWIGDSGVSPIGYFAGPRLFYVPAGSVTTIPLMDSNAVTDLIGRGFLKQENLELAGAIFNAEMERFEFRMRSPNFESANLEP